MVIKSKVCRQNIEDVISKGAKVKEDNPKKKVTSFCLRIPTDLLQKIEAHLIECPEICKTAFIIQSIRENLNKVKK